MSAEHLAETHPVERVRTDGLACRVRGLMRRSGSLRLTPWLIGLLLAGTILSLQLEQARTWPLVVSLALLAANLLAAIASNGVFRRQTALLVFHLSLVALLSLVAAGRLTSLTGHVGVTEGMSFDGELSDMKKGPWHAGALSSVSFINRGFAIQYAPGRQRGPTRNEVAWQSADGTWHQTIVGDQEPLVIAGYRFYTSFNKGFAAIFRWQKNGAPPAIGSVQFPSFPMKEFGQAQEWTPPGSQVPVWVMLDIDEVLLPPEEHASFRLPEKYTLVARIGDERHAMHPGDSIELTDGTLRFEGLRSWMGYQVFYDWTLPWLLAACAVAVCSMGWHFWQKFAARPWDA